jgi:oligosaccharide repeat unit polymerase
MWRTVFRPEVMFGITTLQALSPYLFWQLGWGTPSLNHDNLTYYPVTIWLTGWVCFTVGSMVMARTLPPAPNYALAESDSRVRVLMIVLLAFVLVQAIWITKVYGTLPILSYLRQDGKIDIITANQLQEGSALGQIGLFDVSLSWLNGVLLLLLIVHYEKHKKLTALAITAILFVIAGNLINGKRQGLVRAIVYLVCGLALYSNSLTTAASRLLPMPRNRFVIAAITGVLIVGLVYAFGYIALIRNQGDFSRDGLAELTAYQEYPLLNFEAQCRDAGYGPYQFNLFYPFQRLVPYKLMQSVSITQLDPPVRVEPSSPAGFYEDIQWAMGPLGIIGVSFGIGMLAMYFYSRSLDSAPHLLIYCQMAYNIFVSHSFNEFLILAYFPGVLTVFALCAPLAIRKRSEQAGLVVLRRVA